MKVLIGSPAFPPSLGGIERFAEQLASGLAAGGDDVTVMTSTPSTGPDSYNFRVVRRPRSRWKLRLVRECDVFLQINVSLRDFWPLLLSRRPWVPVHQGLYEGGGLKGALAARVKRLLARRAGSAVSASRYVARRVDPRSVTIPNPYRHDLFRILPGRTRDLDLIFVGRMVSDKGVDILVRALAMMGEEPVLTLVGEGPEEPRIRKLVGDLDLEGRVRFRGRLDGEELVEELNRHRILVVPSDWEEPYGIVALEGIACGCVVVGTERGGLVEAIGACGLVVPNGDVEALAKALADLLGRADLSSFLANAPEHLARHRGEPIVARYRQELRRAVEGGAS